jgi:predicted Rossmann fold nucleotide-binding protein DprA/Smf involved in DNA uptake
MYRQALRSGAPAATAGAEVSGGKEEATPDEAATLALLDDPRPVHVDVLAERAPFGIARLQSALFALVLRGSLDQLPGGYYVARPRKGPVGS